MGKNQLIEFSQNLCNANVDDNEVLFVRVNNIITDKKARFIVPFTHNALVIKGGGDARFYKSGDYDVFDDKAEVKKWKKGCSIEIVYMPKETETLIYWGTNNKAEYRDTFSKKVVKIGARGQFGINIANPEQFFRKVVGAKREFDKATFVERFKAAVLEEYTDIFLHVATENELTYDKFDLHKKEIAKKVGVILSEKFEKTWGIGLQNFIIEGFQVDEADKQKVESVFEKEEQEREEEKLEKKYKEYLAELERLDDKEWEREKWLQKLKQEDSVAYYEVLKVIGKKEDAKKGANFCPKCGHSCETNADFCPNCGNSLGKKSVTCPKCHKVNPGDAAYCTGCGTKL